MLTHCTNLCPVNFKGLDNLYRNSGVNLGILDGAEVAQAEIAACNGSTIPPEYNQATDWPHFNVVNI